MVKLTLISLLLVALGCTQKSISPESLFVISVNGEKYNVVRFSNDLTKHLKLYSALAAKDSSIVTAAKARLLDEFVVSSLLKQLVQSKGITISEGDVSTELARLKANYPNDGEFASAMIENNTSIDEKKERVLVRLYEKKAFDLIDSMEPYPEDKLKKDIQEYYTQKKETFKKQDRIKIQHILVSKEDDAERLLKKIKSGAPFSETAKKFSIAPDRSEGGIIGYIEKGTASAFDAAFKAPIGLMPKVIKSSYGYHIIKVLEKRPAGVLPLTDVEEKIKTHLKAERQQLAFSSWLQEAIKKAHIEKNQKLIDELKVKLEGSIE